MINTKDKVLRLLKNKHTVKEISVALNEEFEDFVIEEIIIEFLRGGIVYENPETPNYFQLTNDGERIVVELEKNTVTKLPFVK